MSPKGDFVPDYTFMGMTCTLELQLFRDRGILYFSFWLKSNWVTFRIPFCKDSSATQERIDDVITVDHIN